MWKLLCNILIIVRDNFSIITNVILKHNIKEQYKLDFIIEQGIEENIDASIIDQQNRIKKKILYNA